MRFLALLLLLSTPAFAEGVAHDPAACPDLTGYFVFPDEVFEPLKLKVTSTRNESGVSELKMLNEDGSEDVMILDGVKKASEGDGIFGYRAACFDNAVYYYEFDDRELTSPAMSTRFYLNGERDLVLDIEQKEGEPRKFSQVGRRQP